MAKFQSFQIDSKKEWQKQFQKAASKRCHQATSKLVQLCLPWIRIRNIQINKAKHCCVKNFYNFGLFLSIQQQKRSLYQNLTHLSIEKGLLKLQECQGGKRLFCHRKPNNGENNRGVTTKKIWNCTFNIFFFIGTIPFTNKLFWFQQPSRLQRCKKTKFWFQQPSRFQRCKKTNNWVAFLGRFQPTYNRF